MVWPFWKPRLQSHTEDCFSNEKTSRNDPLLYIIIGMVFLPRAFLTPGVLLSPKTPQALSKPCLCFNVNFSCCFFFFEEKGNVVRCLESSLCLISVLHMVCANISFLAFQMQILWADYPISSSSKLLMFSADVILFFLFCQDVFCSTHKLIIFENTCLGLLRGFIYLLYPLFLLV